MCGKIKKKTLNTENVSNGSLNLTARTRFTKCKMTTPEGQIMRVHAVGMLGCMCLAGWWWRGLIHTAV